MEKINFVNGQAPYINDTNLNQLQTNVEQAIDEKSSLPLGGTTGQVLAKASNADNDVAWINQTGGGGSSIEVIDNLNSTSTEDALAANQGRILNNKIDLLSGKFNNFTTYTTEEIPIGNWIDGKTLYRKTVNVPNVNSSGQIVASSVSIADTNFETITSLKGIAKIVDDFVSLPYTYDSNFLTLAVTASKNIRIYSKGYSTNQIFVTIEYTKTTD